MDKLILLVSITNAMPYRNPPYRDLTDKAREIAHRYYSVKNGTEFLDVIVECQILLEKVNYKIIGLDSFMHSTDPADRPQIWTSDVYFEKRNGLVLLSQTMMSLGTRAKMQLIYAPFVPGSIKAIHRYQSKGMIYRSEAYSIRLDMLHRSRGTIIENLIRAVRHGDKE